MTQRHGEPTPPRAPDASMTLLTEVYRRPLDPGYAAAARRRAEGRAPHRGPVRLAAAALVAAVLGLAVTAGALALQKPAGSAQRARDVLEESIRDRTGQVAELQSQADELGAQVATLQQLLVGPGETALRDQLAAGAVEAGTVDVSGPGLRIVLSDAPPDAGGTVDADSRVQDIDLQVLVNGLWAAGAEAVAVNDQRLTATTAIRSAGSAVLVDLVPLSSPYRVDVLGDAVGIQTELARSTAGQHLATLRSTFDIGVEISSQSDLTLPGTAAPALRYATVPDPAMSDVLRSPSPTPVPGGDEVPPSAGRAGTEQSGTGATISAERAGGGTR